MITLVKGNKKIQRPYNDYKSNQRMWEIRGFKPEQDVVKEGKKKKERKKDKEQKKVKKRKKR